MEDFTFNPCIRNIFEVFEIDKQETDARVINEARRRTWEKWESKHLTTQDASIISKAELNAMEKRLLDPVERLKAEQFVHQAHRFSPDEELSQCLGRLDSEFDPWPELLAELRKALLARLSRFLPPLEVITLDDDIAWPPVPEPFDPKLETPARTILRDR